MNTKMLVSHIILCLAAVIALGSCTTRQQSLKEAPLDPFYGTWFNEEYIMEAGTWTWPPKLIIYPDGTVDAYTIAKTQDGRILESPPRQDEYTITESWVDRKGNHFYKGTWYKWTSGQLFFALYKVNNSNTVLEWSMSSVEYPSEIDKDSYHYYYAVYYRQ